MHKQTTDPLHLEQWFYGSAELARPRATNRQTMQELWRDAKVEILQNCGRLQGHEVEFGSMAHRKVIPRLHHPNATLFYQPIWIQLRFDAWGSVTQWCWGPGLLWRDHWKFFLLGTKNGFSEGFLDLPLNWDLKPFCGPDHFHTESQLQWHADATSLWNLTKAQEQNTRSRARLLVQFRPIKKVRQIRLMKVSASPGTSRPFQQMQDAPSTAKICWCPTHKLQICQSVTRSNMYSWSSLIQSPSLWLSLAKKKGKLAAEGAVFCFQFPQTS